jgi:hypothetical protein
MPLVSSGQIDFSDINVELGLTATAPISLGATNVRTLYGIPSGAIRLAADGYGKSSLFYVTNPSPIRYDFNLTQDSFTASGATLSTNISFLTVQSNSTDPLIRRTVSFSGAEYSKIVISIFRTRGNQWDGKVFYTTAGHGESASFYKQFAEPAWDGTNYQTITIDMRTLTVGGTDWTSSTITGIRFDFGFSNNDDFRIDFIEIDGPITPSAGLYQYTQAGYYADNVNFFTSMTATGPTNVVASTLPALNTSYQYLGYFLATATGTFTFGIASDDAGYLWVGANAISGFTTSNATIAQPGLRGPVASFSGNFSLTTGRYYPIRFMTGNSGGGSAQFISWNFNGGSQTNDGTGVYFHNADTLGF